MYAAQSLVAVVPDVAETFGTRSVLRNHRLHGAVCIGDAVFNRAGPYAATAVGAVTCLVAANWGVLIAGVVIMAVANAFTLPVLQVLLRELAPVDRLGVALGRYSAAQSLGNCAAPLVGGLLAEADNGRPDWRLLALRIFSIFVVGFCVIGMATVLTIHLDSVFAMPASQRGFVIMAGGAAAFALASRVGASVDKRGAPVVLTVCAAAAAVALAGMPCPRSPLPCCGRSRSSQRRGCKPP